jgi:hypothetical protein
LRWRLHGASLTWGAERMTVLLRNEHMEKTREQFRKAGLEATAFTGCTQEEIGMLLLFQQDILLKSYDDYLSMIGYCSTNYIYAMEYKKRKEMFAAYAADNSGVTRDVPMNFATVMIYKNAMTFELNELCRFFHIFMATDADCARRTPGRITPRPEEVFERYYSGYAGCLSVVFVAFVTIGYLLSLA